MRSARLLRLDSPYRALVLFFVAWSQNVSLQSFSGGKISENGGAKAKFKCDYEAPGRKTLSALYICWFLWTSVNHTNRVFGWRRRAHSDCRSFKAVRFVNSLITSRVITRSYNLV